MGKQPTQKVVVFSKSKLQLDRKCKQEILKVLRSHDPEFSGLSFEYGRNGELRGIRVEYRKP